jgi:hypothetical protein
LLDLNFFDRSASTDHARALNAPLRYVNHEVFGDPAGIMIEDAALNGVEDADYSGSGAYPAGWRMLSQSGSPADLTAKFIKTGAGKSRLQLQGRSAGDFYVTTGSSRRFAIVTGDLLTGSVAIRLADGDRGSLKSLGLLILENNADGAVANPTPSVAPVQQIQTDKAWWAQVQIVAGLSGFANLAVKVTTSGKFDLTFEINFPQLEKRAWRSTICRGQNARSRSLRMPRGSLLQVRFGASMRMPTTMSKFSFAIGLSMRKRLPLVFQTRSGLAWCHRSCGLRCA